MPNNLGSDLPQLLIISYFYPPLENAGTRPVVKLVKYLPEFGYRPLILTTRNYGDLPDDATRLTFRADEWLGLVKRLVRRFKFGQLPAQPADRGLLPPGGRLERWKLDYLIPDPKIIWYWPAVRRGLQLIRSQPIKLIYSVSPPETSHLIALKLKQKSGLPWVVDFRDGWLFEPLIPARLNSALRRPIEARLERRVVHCADHLIVVNEVMAADLAQRYPQAAGKISVVANGYDPDDLAGLQRRAASPAKFRLVYTGSFSLSRAGTSLTGLLQALQALQQAQAPLLTQLEIGLVGNLTEPERQAIAAAGLSPYFVLHPPVPHRQALQYQLDADVLLLVVTPEATGISTSKLAEYLASGRPILALAGRSVAGQIVAELEAGLVVAADDVAGIKSALQTFYQRWVAGQLPSRVDSRVAARFDRRRLTEKVAAILAGLIAQAQRVESDGP